MNTINALLNALEERTIAQHIGIRHDEIRMQFSLRKNTVGSFDEFSNIIGEYYNYHFAGCVSSGGSLSHSEARSRAKTLLNQEYRRNNGDIVTGYNDCHDGTNGGLRAVLDIIANGLKSESVESYIRDTFDRYVTPNSWDQKVGIMREFINQYGRYLSNAIRTDKPESYARDYEELIRAYVDGLRRVSGIFRRI